MPDHEERKLSHQCRSAFASLFKVMWWCRQLMEVLRSMRWQVFASESSRIPRKVMEVAGPLVLSCFTGAFILVQSSVMSCMFYPHTSVFGCPAVK